MQTFQTLQLIPVVLLGMSRCSQVPLEVSKVLSHCPRVFSNATDISCSFRGAFWMLWNLTNRKVKFGGSWYFCADLQKTLKAAETAVQYCRRLCVLLSQWWSSGFHNCKVFCLWYLSLLKSHSPHQHVACSIYPSLSMYIHTVHLAADASSA
jgi:hypothetical protein